MLRRRASEAGEELYRQALTIAKEQEAKFWELRAAVALASFAATRVAARSLRHSRAGLRLVTEGFDTQDLEGRPKHCLKN